MTKLLLESAHKFDIYKYSNLKVALIAKVQKHFLSVHKCSASSQSFEKTCNLSCFEVNGKQIRIAQHYFDTPVEQPRAPKGRRRLADLSGLKGRLTLVLLLLVN